MFLTKRKLTSTLERFATDVRSFVYRGFVCGAIVSLASLSAGAADKASHSFTLTGQVRTDAKGVPLTAPEAAIDKVAYSYQKKAIIKIQRLLQSSRGKNQEPAFLIRLAKMQLDNADITFRVAHAEAYDEKRPINYAEYHKGLEGVIRTLNVYIQRFNDTPEVARAYQMRGRAYAELGKKRMAVADYTSLIQRFPKTELVNAAYLALAEYAEDEKDHKAAIGFLVKVLSTRSDPEYPYALFKLAWSHYNLDDIDSAFDYTKKYIAYYNSRMDADDSGRIQLSSQMLRDELIVDSTLFYVRGIEASLPRYQVRNAIQFYKQIATGLQADSALAKALVQMTKLFRSRNLEGDLVAWKNLVLQTMPNRQDTLEVLLLVMEDQMNRYRHREFFESSRDLMDLYKRNSKTLAFDQARDLLIKAAERVQKTIQDNKEPPRNLSLVLAGIYSTYLRMIDEKDPRVFKIRFNIANAFAAAGDVNRALEEYLWVMKRGDDASAKDFDPEAVTTAGFQAVGLRYQDFRTSGVIPKEVQPHPVSDDKGDNVNPNLRNWIRWISWVEKRDPESKIAKEMDFYAFEGNRALYAAGSLVLAVDRMRNFVNAYPRSKYAVPSAQLVIDTMIASKDWGKTHEYARWFARVPAWSDQAKLIDRFNQTAVDAYYKMTEASFEAGDFAAVIARKNEFESLYGSSKRKPDFLSLVAKASLQANDEKGAMEIYSQLLRESPDSAYAASALLAKATQSEKTFRFETAALEFRQYLGFAEKNKNMSESDRGKLREKILFLTWMSGDSRALAQAALDPKLCGGRLAHACDQYEALAAIAEGAGGSKTVALVDKKLKEKLPVSNQVLWSFLLLGTKSKLPRDRRVQLIERISSGWNRLDSLVQYSLLTELSVAIPATYELLRLELPRTSPVKADEKVIAKRLGEIRELEKLAARVLQLPFVRVHVSVLNEVAGMYHDLARDLKLLRAPSELSDEERTVYNDTMAKAAQPFADAGNKVRLDAFRLASNSGVEEATFQLIARPLFEADAKLAQALLPKGDFVSADALSVDLLKEIDADKEWLTPSSEPRDEKVAVKAQWAVALEARLWVKVGYLLQLSKDRNLVPAPMLEVMRGISLAVGGARAEALKTLEDARKGLSEKARKAVTSHLVQAYTSTLSVEKTKRFVKEMDDTALSLNSAQTTLVTHLTGVQLK